MQLENSEHQIAAYSVLLKKYFEGTLSLSERSELAGWLWEDRRNRFLFSRIKSARSLKTYYEIHEKINPDEEYKLLVQCYPEIQQRRIKLSGRFRWVAAVCVLLLGTTLWYKYGNVEKVSIPEILPHTEKVIAVLKTAEGKVFQLNGMNVRMENGQVAGLQLKDSLKELICEQIPLTDSFAIHELVIPKGGEYKLILSDGTRVWLNSDSKIRFPGVFGETEREITLSGEAYLEVTHDVSRPFRVRADEGVVEVLGTSFGITTYPGERKWSAVLVEGSVKATYGGNSLLLRPGQMAVLRNNKLEEEIGDTDKELDWVYGYFIFRHDRLEEVVRKLSRWYDVEFEFREERLKDYVFTGQVNRDMGIGHILDLMKCMNVVDFEKTEKRIVIKKKPEISNR